MGGEEGGSAGVSERVRSMAEPAASAALFLFSLCLQTLPEFDLAGGLAYADDINRSADQ